MGLTTCGIAGIGLLGSALTQQLELAGVNVLAYHPKSERRSAFVADFDRVEAVDFSELLNQEIVLLAIPAEAIRPFLKDAQKEITAGSMKPRFVNLSTLVSTKELNKEFSDLQIVGVKMVGHSKYLYEHGDGVFVTETPLNTKEFQPIRSLFEKIGTLYEDKEEVVREVNGQAVRKIVEACVQFQKETENYREEYREKAMDSIFPHSMKMYREGDLDGFMRKIIEEMEE